MPLPPDPVAFVIPFIDRPVYWYGLMITLGTLVAAFVADREARRRGENPDHVWNALIVVMIFGLIGARLYHVISSPAGDTSNLQSYLDDPVKIISFWSGGLRGLGIFGALVGGVFGLWLYTKWQKLPFALWADICVVGVPLGQAIGRWGNYFNQELYGGLTDLPWGIPIDPIYRLPEFAAEPASARFHPTFLYESIVDLLIFFVLAYVAHHWEEHTVPGDIALLYLILYPLGRYFVELQRPDAWLIAGVPTAQLVSVVTIVGASALMIYRHRVFRRMPGQSAPA
ncbi:MAG: prolipoprotein diacylglyceryl transferase [Anaerolineae bacterium]